MRNLIKSTLLLLALLIPTIATAHDIEVDGIYYYIDGNEAYVTCRGDSYYNHNTYSGDVTIPSTVTHNGTTYSVTAIVGEAFYGCSGLTSVTIPNSVTTICDGAFSYCSGLTSISVENGNPVFDSRDNCNAIIETASNTLIVGCKATVIPNSVTTIECNAFYGCCGLTSISIPNSVTAIGSNAFYECSGLTSIDIPNSVTLICAGTFLSCTGLTSITIPNSVTTIGSYAFGWCSSLTSINIPNSVTEISKGAFSFCSGLTSISVENDNPVYNSHDNCNAIIETASNSLIVGCKATVIPNSVTTIGWGAFDGCTGLTSITIPNSVTTIDESAFYGCGLTSIDIPNSVTTIGDDAFFGCTGLKDVFSFIVDPTAISMGYSVFYQSSNYTERTLHVPVGTVHAYQADTKWNQYFEHIYEIGNEPVLISSIELNETSTEIVEGQTLQLTATVLPEVATNKTVTWTSSDDAIATVDSTGLVTAIAPGSAIITATTNDGSNLSASCDVTVLKRIVQAESIKLNVTTAGLNEGATLQLIANVLPEECDNKNVIWSSNNPSVATVDSNGLVTTHGIGTAAITAMTTDGSNLSTSCTVTLLPVGVKGDINNDSSIDVSDVTALINFILNGFWH